MPDNLGVVYQIAKYIKLQNMYQIAKYQIAKYMERELLPKSQSNNFPKW